MHIFMRLDFARYGDKQIIDAVGNAPVKSMAIPLKYRQSPKLVDGYSVFVQITVK